MNDQLEERLRHHLSVVDRAPVSSAEALDARVARRDRRRRARARTAAGVGCAALVAVGATALWAGRTDRPVDAPASSSDGADDRPSTSVTVASTADASTDGTGPTGLAQAWAPIAAEPGGPRQMPAVVWTGREALVIGGTDRSGEPRADAVAYDPSTDRWRRLADPPDATADPLVAWTGHEMLVIGGTALGDSAPAGAVTAGRAYDPASDSWRWTAPPFSFIDDESPWAWTGEELLVWPRNSPSKAPVGYDPERDAWRTLAAPPIGNRWRAGSVWTGDEWIIWGGTTGDAELADGAAYDPASDTWRVLAPSPLSARRVSAVWTGSEMIVDAGSTGGDRATGNGEMALSDGAAYDPASDTWRPITAGFAHPGFVPVWTGEQLVMFAKGAAAVYDVAGDTWVDTCCGGAPGATPVWTGTEVLLIGSFDSVSGGATFHPGAAKLAP
jgi:hypothetical protein